MTPVQLPEVPAREVVAHHIHGTEAEVLAFRLDMRNLLPGDLIGQSVHVLTADHLRAYATEAIRLNMKQFLPACEALKREAIREQIGGLTRGDPGKIANADRLIALLTQPEQNSER